MDLWPEVIRQAYDDARGVSLRGAYFSRGERHSWSAPSYLRMIERCRVAYWLRSPDFEIVCENTGLDPDRVRNLFGPLEPDIDEEEIESFLATRYRGLAPEVRDAVSLTHLDRAEYLARLRRWPAEEALRRVTEELDRTVV